MNLIKKYRAVYDPNTLECITNPYKENIGDLTGVGKYREYFETNDITVMQAFVIANNLTWNKQ